MDETPNLDCMDVDDLEQFASDPTSHHVLAQYACHKCGAIRARLAGNIPRALELEALCDRIYGRLPRELQW